MSNVVGAYYLHENGKLIFKPAIVFASEPEYFNSPFVKHVWLILKAPPSDTRSGQLTWLLKDFLQAASSKGALATEVTAILTSLLESDEYGALLKGYTKEDLTRIVVAEDIEPLLEVIRSRDVSSLKEASNGQ